jgi:protocatechuate 3,4-dioxygenase beta subunit
MYRSLIEKAARWLATGFVAATLAACGGGSSCSDAFGGTACSGSGGGGGGTGGSAPTLTLALSSTTVTAGAPATVTASVKNGSGDPVAGTVVDFVSAGGLGSFSAPSALTNDSGVAVVTLTPADAQATGADSVIATTSVAGTALTATAGFQLTATEVTIASVVADIADLDAYEQTAITVNLAGVSLGVPVNVSLSSSCVSKGRATLTPTSVTTSTGVATFTYRDSGCGAFDAVDNLQASVAGTTAAASLQLTLTAPAVSSISFVSAAPQTVYLRGSGFVENSNVTFRVLDANGAGVPNTSVTLEPTTLAGGLLIDGGSVAVTKRTDADGNVIARVNSGTVPTPVRIKATLVSDPTISTLSSSLSIAVGLPSQLNFSLSQATRNIEAMNVDGTPNTYTIIASDRLGNPVPDGTAINFVTEGGQVQASVFTVVTNGLSSAVASFQSSDPRPTDGRVTVTAYALGEESFLDTNGDNVYSAGEDYQDLGDVFLDRLLNRSYNSAEDQFISLSISGTSPCRVASSALLRLDASTPSRSVNRTGAAENTCVAGWGRAYVRRAVETVFSTSEARPMYGKGLPPGAWVPAGQSCPSTIRLIGDIDRPDAYYELDDTPRTADYYVFGTVARVGVAQGGTISLYVSDANGVAFNPMAAGTKITVASTEGLSAAVLGGSPVPSTGRPSTATLSYKFDNTTTSGTVTVTFASPSGLSTSWSQSLDMNDPPPGGTFCP